MLRDFFSFYHATQKKSLDRKKNLSQNAKQDASKYKRNIISHVF